MTTLSPPSALFGPEYTQNPYPVYAWLREHSPIHEFRFPIGDVRMWMVTRYDDVRALLGDTRFSTEGRKWGSEAFNALGLTAGTGSLLEDGISVVDAPAHTRLRRVAMGAFTPRRIATWRDTISRIVNETLDACARKGEIDVLDDYAGVISSTVLAEILGIRIERHAELVENLSRCFPADPALQAEVPQAFSAICDYAADIVAEKRLSPGDDLTTALLDGTEGGERLTDDEVVAMVASIALGGGDTIRAFLGSAILALIDHPGQRDLLVADPSLAPAAVEEFVRYDAPFTTVMFRLAKEDVTHGGVTIPAGDAVIMCQAAANRDPARFTDPDRLDLLRENNRHLGWGHGIHNCMGAALARLEGEIAVPAFFRRFPDLRLVGDRADVRFIESFALRRIDSLHVEVL
ncbi:cytochrome P450 [Lentzea sp. NBRC 102530]|uniref:cytochrome P450 family protein n=1 Tax=Lentzea sp. NBRC 102530 TaxID=3032201 RepID=UPI0024A359C4|nr:cytochrome P450 [Lentzea sp. NBRC 102530]GLY46851.1 cytochrome P450 hydroxylase [Lentzea sp. NBRC 102530]